MRAVNLLPKDAGKPQRRTPNPALLVGVGGGVLAAAFLGMSLMNASASLTEKRDLVADAEVRLAAIPEPPAVTPQADDTQLVAQEQARRTALDAALGRRLPWDAILRRFSLVLPEDVWLTSLSAAGVAPATSLTIGGYTYSHDGVARLLARLAVISDLGDIQLKHSTLTRVSDREVVEFSVTATVAPKAASS